LAARWGKYLAFDRRRSPHTVRAYVATAYRFLEFLQRYRGEEIGRFGLLNLHAADLRAFLADRRGEGLGAASASREMSAVRGGDIGADRVRRAAAVVGQMLGPARHQHSRGMRLERLQ
jgi:hypothetical protein